MNTHRAVDNPIRQKIEALEFDETEASFTFTQRIARENGWTADFAVRAISEYKRFLVLVSGSEKALTPSDEVDQVWHLHLTYTRHYWDILCGEILGRPLHHGPTRGGEQEDRRYLEQYEYTLHRYRETFGERPPADIWPDPAERFAGRPVRIDRERCWILPKPVGLFGFFHGLQRAFGPHGLLAVCACVLILGIFGFAGVGIAAEYSLLGITLAEELWTALIFLGFFVFLYWVASRKRSGKGPGGPGGCGAGCGSGCGGGGCGS